MRKDHTIKKQTGKQTPILHPIGNGAPSAVLVLKDTLYYQVSAHGDYVQEVGG